jgi:hypothetical protein
MFDAQSGREHLRVDTTADTDPLQALKPLATLLAKRKITAPEFDAAVAYLGLNDGRRAAVEARMARTEGKIVRNLRMLHPTDAVTRAVPCSRADVVHRLRKALDQLGRARTASDAPPLTESRREGRADKTPAPIRSDAHQFRTGPTPQDGQPRTGSRIYIRALLLRSAVERP